MSQVTKAQQGHRYRLGERSVLAMKSGEVIEVREINDEAYPLGRAVTVKAEWLKAEPMKYFHGQTPA